MSYESYKYEAEAEDPCVATAIEGLKALMVKASRVKADIELRDYFAGQALAAMANAIWEIRERQGNGPTAASKAEAYAAAIAAYTIADAMLAEREKGGAR